MVLEDEVSFKVDKKLLEEIERIRSLTGFDVKTQFCKGYTLLRIALETYQNGGELYRVMLGDKETIKIPGYNASESDK